MENPLMKHGAMSWMELMTCDVKGAKDFYSAVFSWEFEEYVSDSSMEYEMIKVKGAQEPFAGVFDKKDALVDDSSAIPPHWGNYITVDNIETSLELVQSLGGNIIVPKTGIPNIGDFAVIQDPQGAVISIMQYLDEMKNC